MTKYVLFDLDGTLTNPYEGITSCIKYALNSVNIEENDPQKLRSYIGPPLRKTFALYGFDEEKCEQLVAKYREKYLVTGIHENITYDNVPEMLKSLREHGCKISLASCKPEKACITILEEKGLLKYFDEVCGATEDKTLDTKPAIIAAALQRLKVPENELEHTYMVGDRDMDIIGAQENHIHSIGALYGYCSENELENVGAEYLIENPSQITEIILGKD